MVTDYVLGAACGQGVSPDSLNTGPSSYCALRGPTKNLIYGCHPLLLKRARMSWKLIGYTGTRGYLLLRIRCKFSRAEVSPKLACISDLNTFPELDGFILL